MDKKERFDEELQVTGCTLPAYQRGNNSFPSLIFMELPVMSWIWHKSDNYSSAIVSAVSSLHAKSLMWLQHLQS